MSWLRSTWGARAVVTLVLAGLFSVTLASAFRVPRAPSMYEQWVRSQLQGPVDDAVSEALVEAAAAHARTLGAYLTAFVEAYQARHPGAPASRALFAVDLPTDALIVYLESRYLGFVGGAVLPRLLLTATPPATSPITQRLAAFAAVTPRGDAGLSPVSSAGRMAVRAAVVIPLRFLSSARPLGP